MTLNAPRPAPFERADLGICAATTLCSPESTPLPFSGQVPTRTVLWLARRGRVSIAHAAALAEANRLGGAA